MVDFRNFIKRVYKYNAICLVLVLPSFLLAQNKPTVTGSSTLDNLVKNKNWKPVPNLSDEFSGSTLNDKWNPNPIANGFYWPGRFPGLFEVENVRVTNGELWLEAEKFESPKAVNGKNWTHGGAIVRSVDFVQPTMYIEARMRTTETLMSGTFWMQNSRNDCENVPKTELDVTESIGRKTNTYRQPELSWYREVAEAFNRGINSTARRRETNCATFANRGKRAKGNIDPSEDFHIYGFYWETPTRLHFYFDGEYVYSITDPPIELAHGMAIIVAIETYDFNWPSGNLVTDGFKLPNGQDRSLKDRSTRYDWIRTWEIDGTLSNTDLTYNNKIVPHPTVTKGFINLPEVSGGWQLFDIQGKFLKHTTNNNIDLSKWENGLYFLKTKSKTWKVILNK